MQFMDDDRGLDLFWIPRVYHHWHLASNDGNPRASQQHCIASRLVGLALRNKKEEARLREAVHLDSG
jgi:hypothetical protein